MESVAMRRIINQRTVPALATSSPFLQRRHKDTNLASRIRDKLLARLDPQMDISDTDLVRRTITELFPAALEEENLVPTGEILPVEGTPYDFRNFKTFGQDLKETGIGYDNCYVLKNQSYTPGLCAVVHSPESGITLEVRTNAPGLQLYTANYLDGSLVGKHGIAYPQYGAFCLETQHFPDAPHHPAFPSAVLNPGETYFHRTIFSLYSRD